jgi:hypothetical protein
MIIAINLTTDDMSQTPGKVDDELAISRQQEDLPTVLEE